jgi:transposase
MNATTVPAKDATVVGVDLAKSVFQLAVADGAWKVMESHRLTRTQFERWFVNRRVDLVIMEACGSAHHWARWLNALGIAVTLLEAARCADIIPVRVKSIEQQALQGLHRTRSLWQGTRTSRINALRGFCREFGIVIAQGSRLGVEQISRALADPHSAVPALIRRTMQLLVEEIRLLETRISQLERELTLLARQSAACATLLSIPGVGLLTATAMVAATSGNVQHFRDARHFASWFGLTPKEHSSGSSRHLGRISKRGDRYLRMLLTHGARSVLRAASVAANAGRTLDALRHWALSVQGRSNHNKATCALANKLARICYATLRDEQPYGQPAPRLGKKINRAAFAIAN